jgi:hypothetical protein
MIAVAALGLLGMAYVNWVFYSALVLYPNSANYEPFGIFLLGTLLTLGMATFAVAYLILRSISGRNPSRKTIYSLLILIAVIWLPFFLISPSAVVFLPISLLLLMLHQKFGRPGVQASTE